MNPPDGAALLSVGLAGALMAGISASLHCALMCGPLACSVLPGGRGPARWRAAGAYHFGRLAAYGLVMGALGAVGGAVSGLLSVSVRPYLPWIMAATLVAAALDLWKYLRPIPGLTQVASRGAQLAAKFSRTARAGAMGAVTPLLPCGLIYGVMAGAAVAGGALPGMGIGLAFAGGSLPALALTQLPAARLDGAGRRVATFLGRAVPLVAAAVLVYRALQPAAASCH
jgi:uncharacterized protein